MSVEGMPSSMGHSINSAINVALPSRAKLAIGLPKVQPTSGLIGKPGTSASVKGNLTNEKIYMYRGNGARASATSFSVK